MDATTSGKTENGPIELLAPAGNIAAGYAALHYGADAVYLGLASFSARAAAENFSIDELAEIVGYAHSLKKRRKIYAAVNTLVLQNELDALIDLLAAIAAAGVDAVIVQDFGVLNILRRYFPRLKAHASTQMAIHNIHGAETARQIGMTRVTLARELTLGEIGAIAAKSKIETEVFVHGALCYSYSGLCLFSSHLYGRSGNRGRCAYPCREWFRPARPERDSIPARGAGGFVFSMKDLALPHCIAALRQIGVTALKIEGRMKSPLYVAAAVNYYRRLIDGRFHPAEAREFASDLQTIFSRPWTDLYLRTRNNRGVTDPKIQGHRGSPAGRVQEIKKYPGGHFLRFKTTLPIELHDGLQIDIEGQPRPFGFAVKNIHCAAAACAKRVFAAPAGASVEIRLPRGHPPISPGAVVYSASSQKVKQQYVFSRPKPGCFRPCQTADFEVRVEENGLDLAAASAGVKARKHIAGFFQPAKDIKQVEGAIEAAFQKLGNTHLKLGKLAVHNPHNLFVPISLLNAARRGISRALELEIDAGPQKYADEIKAEFYADRTAARAARPESGNLQWNIKTDQPHLLAAFGSEDWRAIGEVIVECAPDIFPEFFKQLPVLSEKIGPVRLRLALPAVMRSWEMDFFVKTVKTFLAAGRRQWQISNLGAWSFLHSLADGGTRLDISADWPMYARNRAAVLQLKTLGINGFTLSPEDDFENARALLSEFAGAAAAIVYQDTPLMVSETRVAIPENHVREMRFASSRGDQIRIVSRHGRNTVLSGRPFCLAAHLNELTGAGAVLLRADFMHRAYAAKEMLDIWRRLRAGLRLTEGQSPFWNRRRQAGADRGPGAPA